MKNIKVIGIFLLIELAIVTILAGFSFYESHTKGIPVDYKSMIGTFSAITIGFAGIGGAKLRQNNNDKSDS